MTAVAVAPRLQPAPPASPTAPPPAPATLSLREAVSQISDSSRNLLGLMALANAAQRDLNSGSPETTLDGVISKAVLRSLLGALHYRDVGTLRHSRRVALLAAGLAHHLGWEGRHLRVLEVAALLHDVGKIGVPDNVLYKPGKLSAEEVELMDLHHGIGLNVLQACRVDPEVLRIVDQAHRAYSVKDTDERVIRDVHIGARILAVADAYESLCTEQVYRVAKPHEEIMNLLMAESGKQFDGNVVNSLARWVQQDGLPFAAQTAELNGAGSQRAPFSLEEAAESMALCQIFSYLYMLESLYDGFYVVDAERKFIVWNRGLERLVNRPASAMLGKEWSPSLFNVPNTDRSAGASGKIVSSHDQALEAKKSQVFQLTYQKPDLSSVQLELQTVPLIDGHGRTHGVAEIVRNLSRKSHAPEFNQLKLQASRDALTSVANRGELEKQLRLLFEQYNENPLEPYCVIFADADHFKRVNDTFGHQVGDQVLIDLARHFSEETYSGEVVGRYGGEEFVILCPATELEQAVRRADRLRSSLKLAKVGGVEKLKMTCSFGVSQVEPGDSTETLLRRADRALYAAKESGRDRTCYFTAEMLETNENAQAQNGDIRPFEFSGSFSALVPPDMIVQKLGGFVKDHHAQLLDVSRERVVLKMPGVGGIRGLFESAFARQGIEIELLMDGAERADRSKKLRVNIRMRPDGKFRDALAFNQRTQAAMRELKHYFAAE